MPIRRFELQNLPYTFQESDCHGWRSSSDDSMSTPSTPSSDSSDHTSRDHIPQTRRKRRGPRIEKKSYSSPPHDRPMTKNDLYFSLDCEMVGVGPQGIESAVARVTICNWGEKIVLDTFVQVPAEVTDYRTFVSGIKAEDLESENAFPLAEVRNKVKSILHGKILIGHALGNDLAALRITHPWHDIRDSATYPPFMKRMWDSESETTVLLPRKLKELVRYRIGRNIQVEGKAHNPIEDARAALRLYKAERLQWETLVVRQVALAREGERRENPAYGREVSVSYRNPPPNLVAGHKNIFQQYTYFNRNFVATRATSTLGGPCNTTHHARHVTNL